MHAKLRVFLVIIVSGLFVSCATGQYMELKPSENAEILGTVQTAFMVNGSFRYRSTINTQAYIYLLAEAQRQFPDTTVEIRDIIWAMGSADTANNNFEYTAIGKVIRLQR
jgi:hypothetical protein